MSEVESGGPGPAKGVRQGGFWLLLCAVVVLSLSPVAYLPPQTFSVWDKVQHAWAFMALAVLSRWAYPHRWWRLGLGLLAFGGAIELAQTATGWRYGEWADWVADAVGLLLGWGLAVAVEWRARRA